MKTPKNKKRLQVRTKIENLGNSLDITDLKTLILWLQSKLDDYTKQGYSCITLTFEYAGNDEPYDLVFRGIRYETDEEYSNRMAKIQAEKDATTAQKEAHRKYILDEAKKLGFVK